MSLGGGEGVYEMRCGSLTNVAGCMVLPRTPVPRYSEDEEVVQAREELDASMLPPG